MSHMMACPRAGLRGRAAKEPLIPFQSGARGELSVIHTARQGGRLLSSDTKRKAVVRRRNMLQECASPMEWQSGHTWRIHRARTSLV